MLFLTTLFASAVASEPAGVTCCDDAAVSTTLGHYLRTRTSLLEDTKVWSGVLQAWQPQLKTSAQAASPEEAEVFLELNRTVNSIQRTWKAEKARERWSELTPLITYLLLRHPGDEGTVVAEARCGEEHWIQPVDEPLTPLIGKDCTPVWIP